MSFRTILGRAFLTSTDWIIINSDLDKVREYTAEVLERERRIEEERKAAEARERARKAEEARLAAIRKAEEERKRAEEARKRKQEKDREEPQKKSRAGYDGPRFSIAAPPEPEGRFSLDEGYSDTDLFSLNRPYRFDDILENPAVSRGIRLDMTFCEKLRQILSQKRMASTDVYKAANVEKSLFSKIYNNKDYKPNKDTAVSIALGLELTLEEAEDLLGRAGYMLSHSDVRDIVLECCFRKKIYNVIEVNIILDKLGYKPLSRVSY